MSVEAAEYVPCVGDRLREVAGTFPTGVTVLTAMADGQPVGMAANSFTSLSLSPALVLVCIGRSSTTWPTIERVGRFCINILSDGQESLARAFAAKGTDRFVDVGYALSACGAPLIEGSLAYLDCTISRTLDGGDHIIVIAEVTDLGVLGDQPPLIFHRSRFGRLSAMEVSSQPLRRRGRVFGPPAGPDRKR